MVPKRRHRSRVRTSRARLDSTDGADSSFYFSLAQNCHSFPRNDRRRPHLTSDTTSWIVRRSTQVLDLATWNPSTRSFDSIRHQSGSWSGYSRYASFLGEYTADLDRLSWRMGPRLLFVLHFELRILADEFPSIRYGRHESHGRYHEDYGCRAISRHVCRSVRCYSTLRSSTSFDLLDDVLHASLHSRTTPASLYSLPSSARYSQSGHSTSSSQSLLERRLVDSFSSPSISPVSTPTICGKKRLISGRSPTIVPSLLLSEL